MIEWLGLTYGIAKVVVGYIKKSSEWKEDEKLVDTSWPEKSGLTAEAAKNGLELRWSAPDIVESRKFDGWEEVYSLDENKRTKSKLVQKNGAVLIGRQKA